MARPKNSVEEHALTGEPLADDNPDIIHVEYEAPPPSQKKGKAPTESQIIMYCCDWLEATSKDDMPEMAGIQRIRVLVSDHNFTLAWQYLIPMIEGRHGTTIVTG